MIFIRAAVKKTAIGAILLKHNNLTVALHEMEEGV